jgi:hypothetical protein
MGILLAKHRVYLKRVWVIERMLAACNQGGGQSLYVELATSRE